jgi:carnitine 3-dehydrogenase
MPPLTALIGSLATPDVTDALKQTVVDGVLHEVGERSVDQLANQENEVLLGLLALRSKAGL